MGFGRGILATPRRGRRLLSEPDAPFGTIVSRFAARNVTVLTPAGTPPFVAPRERSQPPRFPHEEDFYDLVPRHDEPDAPPRRTLITDARDLLLSTLYEMTAVRGEDGQIVPEGSPLLACEVEGMNPQPPELGSPGHVPGWIHVGLTRRAEELLRDAEVQRAARELEWDGRLDSLDGDGYIVLIRMRRPVAPPGSSNGTVTSEGVILPAGWDWEVHAERHVVLVGGSDTATYYAVADFLRRHAGVRWLFPGRLGTVIPEAPSLDLDEPSQLRIEEPDFRGRTLVAISDGGAPRVITPGGAPVLSQTDPEIHDVRNWLLRNRLHPAGERAVLFHRRSLPADHPESPSFAGCVGLPPHTRKYLSLESRIPVGHNLSHFFSPNQSSWDAVSYTTPGATRSEPSAVTYPDPRPQRLAPPDTTPLGTFPAMMEQDEFPCELTQSPVPCTSPNRAVCRCPTEEQTQILGSISDGSFLEVAIRVAPRVGTVCTLPLKVIEDLGRFARTIAVTEMPATRRNVRFIPRTTRATHTQESAPAQGWAPCFFAPASDGRGSETPLAHFRETLAVDLANQLLFLNLNRRVLWRVNDPEFCESLGTDDGEGLWCECVPCRSTNSRDGANGGVLLFKGQAWLRNFHKFENGRNAANTVDLRLRELWLCQDPERLREQALKAHGVLLEAYNELSGRETSTLRDAVGLSRLPTNVGAEELLDVLDRLALRGLLPDRARTHVRSRRFFVFLNKTALAMTRILHEPASYQGRDPLGLGARFVPLGFQPRHTLLTFLTYLDYTAAPLFEKDPLDSSGRAFFYPTESAPRAAFAAEFDRSSERAQELAQTVLHPCLTPMISGSRDLLEYDDTKFEGWQRFSAAREAAPFWQHRIAPEQLNHRRWGMVAHQTGIYEWMYGRNTLVPRLYTKRLRNALLTGYEDHHARVFLAEVEPNMGLDSVKLYETARLLWDVKTPPETFYAEFCAALCYPSTSAALAMSLYFQKLEEIWCSREQGYRSHVPPQHRHVSGFNYGTFQGYGILGSAGWITEHA